MTDAVSTRRVLMELIQEVLPWRNAQREIVDELSLAGDLGIESLGKVALAFRISEELELELDLDDESIDLAKIETVGDVHAAIALVLARESNV